MKSKKFNQSLFSKIHVNQKWYGHPLISCLKIIFVGAYEAQQEWITPGTVLECETGRSHYKRSFAYLHKYAKNEKGMKKRINIRYLANQPVDHNKFQIKSNPLLHLTSHSPNNYMQFF